MGIVNEHRELILVSSIGNGSGSSHAKFNDPEEFYLKNKDITFVVLSFRKNSRISASLI